MVFSGPPGVPGFAGFPVPWAGPAGVFPSLSGNPIAVAKKIPEVSRFYEEFSVDGNEEKSEANDCNNCCIYACLH